MEKIIDEKFKDDSPVRTVEKIQKLLAEKGISVTEEWGEHTVCNCYALRLNIDGTYMGTNGKGVTRELARASGYAEMVERLQTGMIGPNCRAVYPDSRMMDRKTLKENADVLFDCLSKLVKKFDKVDVSADQIVEAAFDYAGGGDEIEAIPYYNYTDDKMVYIPKSLVMPFYTSTGLAAGNTPEEAMVQGMSEIVERWCQRHFLCMDLVPPTIPEEYLKNYPRAYETITQIREGGYDVYIKDCSMGMGWPAIATVVINKKTHAYHVHMGASPVFEIALGRSLTETFQGRELCNVTDTRLDESAKSDSATYWKSFVKGNGAYPMAYFTDEPSFPFVPFEDRSKCTNKELLRYALNFFAEKNMKVYVRDESHWGFCTYKVIIPQICVAHFGALTSHLNIPQMYVNARDILKDLKKATPDQLFEQHLYDIYRLNNQCIDGIPRISISAGLPISADNKIDIALGYIYMAYAAWESGDIAFVNNAAQHVERLGVSGISDYCSCLNRFSQMLDNQCSFETAERRLRMFYEDSVVDKVCEVLKSNTNPFADYTVSCGEEDENCSECPYVATCRRNNSLKLGKLINKYNMEFDNEAAFVRLKELFRSLPC